MDGDGLKWTTGTWKRGTNVEQLDGDGDFATILSLAEISDRVEHAE